MLDLRAIDAGYGRAKVLREVSFQVEAGKIHCLIGRNGAGKSTTLKTIMGLLPLMAGEIHINGTRLDQLPPEDIPRQGIGYVPQGRRLFRELTVAENIEIGLMVKSGNTDTRERILDLFPRLRERLSQRAETLSGGEQQMLAMARALATQPQLLIMDEPTEGLQPSMIDLIHTTTLKLKNEGTAILLVEQRTDLILEAADHVTVLENGRVAASETGDAIRKDPEILTRYLGV